MRLVAAQTDRDTVGHRHLPGAGVGAIERARAENLHENDRILAEDARPQPCARPRSPHPEEGKMTDGPVNAPTPTSDAPAGPTVLFVCTHNAGRSQMALGFFNRLVGDRATGCSGGSTPGSALNPLVVRAMAERGIDISGEYPKRWTRDLVRAADVVIDMGCGDADPILTGHRFEQWWLPDPADRDMDEVRAIRDSIEQRVRRLVADLGLPVVDRARV
ncbi:arsenate reductase ArsC [Nocardia otitidiscaviarum]|nr:arsenate reductase ArsC [Nocardia otitidiscaviarum]MBF6485107.1 arsenate reductase ArsC [Nocardia otitidiscaviarum]